MKLLFELLRIALRRQDTLTCVPSQAEWFAACNMAKEHDVTGITFDGVRRLKEAGAQSVSELDELLMLKWTGRALKIEEGNSGMSRRSELAVARLEEAGYDAVLLKGSSLLMYYPQHLRQLRGLGDIDVWCRKKANCSDVTPDVYDYVRSLCPEAKGGYLHIGLPAFSETDVEVHVRPCYLNNPWRNRRLQRWCEGLDLRLLKDDGDERLAFDATFLMLHTFKHYVKGEMNLKQLMDCYMVMKRLELSARRREVEDRLASFGIRRFCQELSEVNGHIFETKDCEASHARTMLDELAAGMKRQQTLGGKAGRFVRMSLYYPAEVLFWPWAALTRNRRE